MLRSEAITTIKRGLGFRQTQDAAIIAALKQTQRDLEHGKTLPDWMLAYDTAMAVTANTATIVLPTGFLRFHEEYQVYYVLNGKPVLVPRKNSMEAHAAYPTGGTPVVPVYPQVCVLEAARLVLVPTPTVAFTAYLTYYKAEPVLDSELENAWLRNAANYVIGLAGMVVAGDLRDAGAMQKFTQMAKMGGQAYMGDVVEQELAGRPLVMGRNN